MPTASTTQTTSQRKIEYLSPPAEVSMADRWFEISSVEHFWVRRRFDVLQRLARNLIASAKEMAEIGCGHGLLQRQIEDAYGREVAGFDLNDYALKQNVSRHSSVSCYDIFQRDLTLQSRFDLIFLFDVLEHISQEDGFLEALLFHLTPKGKLVMNVPAGQWAFSEYDQAAGHVRRYSIHTLHETAARSGLRVRQWTYWGLPLVPTLAVRKLWLKGKRDKRAIISFGFDSRSTAINSLLRFASQCELIPQKLLGTSLMAILEKIEK
jgi:2-polyprenyl-3-methyl-5-hydroxy-6-metoxy-1,4-benzoquinol methylase